MSGESFMDGRVVLYAGDCLEVMASLESSSIDAVVTDPPYGLEFMGRDWDGADGFRRSLNAADAGRESVFGRTSRKSPEYKTGPVFQQFMHAMACDALRVLKPGGHIVAFAGTRTYHRMACAIDDAGFEVRDMLSWLYGSGFPKSHDVSKAIDRAAGAERAIVGQGAAVKRMIPGADQHKGGWGKNNGREYIPTTTEAATDKAREFEGWGTALKPACEPICFGRKPLAGTVAANVLEHGTGAINIDRCRVGSDTRSRSTGEKISENLSMAGANYSREIVGIVEGRWPANVCHDGSEEVIAAFPSEAGGFDKRVGMDPGRRPGGFGDVGHARGDDKPNGPLYGDTGSAARFFYTAKADADDRLGSKHPTVKPVDLMQWLCRLVTPKGGTVLDPFAGTGTTGEAAFREGFNAVLIEREQEYQNDIRRRMALCLAGPGERRRESAKAKQSGAIDEGPLFAI